MELTNKDYKIIEFLAEFPVAKLSHIKVFTGYNTRNLIRLVKNDKIILEDDFVILRGKQIDCNARKNVLIALDVLVHFYEKNFISKDLSYIKAMDIPFVAMAKSTRQEDFLYLAIINKGREKIQSKLLDNENRGNVVLILEDVTQTACVDLKAPVVKVVYYESIIND